MSDNKKYYIYMLRCSDNSIYTGITTDINKRMDEHFGKKENCAKYTLLHTAKKLEALWETKDRKMASKLEFSIKKKLSKSEKEKLINNTETLQNLLRELEFNNYKRIEI